jgi:sulfotransferase
MRLTKTIHFIAGMPRSGSTLLANVLAQNPRFHTTATSGILDVLYGVRSQWDNLGSFQAMEPRASEEAKLRVLRGILEAYYSNNDRPVVFDKSRSWLAYLEMTELILGRPARVLVPVRDFRDILASFEKLWRKAAATRQVNAEAQNYFEFQSVEGRCSVWVRGDQPVGLAYNRIKDALQRGFRDRLCFVRFEHLTARPEATLRQVYQFLGEEYYPHNFDRVEQVTAEDDRIYGLGDLHQIRSRIEPATPQWPQVLGTLGHKYANLDLW